MFSIVMPLTSVPNTSAASGNRACGYCGRTVSGGTFVSGVFYCPMCASILNRNNSIGAQRSFENQRPCDGCSSNPSNNPHASGVCHCTLGSIQFG